MKRLTIRLPDGLNARMRQQARRRGVRISALVREALKAHLDRRRLRSVGVGRSGRSDISVRIEEILASSAKRRRS